MIIFGEKLNSSIPATYEALKNCNSEYLTSVAIAQQSHGANYLDLNTAMFGDEELSKMLYLLELVQNCTKCGIMLDSPSVEVIRQTIPKAIDRNIIINSVTLNERFFALADIINEYHAGVVGLPIDDNGIPQTSEKRIVNALKLIELLERNKISHENIYIDVLAQALATDGRSAVTAIQTITAIKKAKPMVHTVCGLSNISFGLPKRLIINSAFLSAAVFAGLDSAIMDITSEQIRNALFASLVVAGEDEYCMDYIKNNRNNIVL
jgi:5-methyltetrahydrofolate corrinoid/iron sulfur protein methyltransferase